MTAKLKPLIPLTRVEVTADNRNDRICDGMHEQVRVVGESEEERLRRIPFRGEE